MPMKVFSLRATSILVVMLIAAGLAAAAKPRIKVADLGPKVNIDTMIPREFGEWTIDASITPILPSPEVQALLNRLYNQTLARTYVNREGKRIMLSVAYGGDQSDSMQVHRPEVCYAAQGFQVLAEVKGQLVTTFGVLPVKRLLAQQGARVEPITYWITVGDKPTYPGLRQKLAQLTYGLTGKIPDGILVRVSSIDRDQSSAYALQENFVERLVESLSIDDRKRLIGTAL